MAGDVGARVISIHRSTQVLSTTDCLLTDHSICIQVLVLLFARRLTLVRLVVR